MLLDEFISNTHHWEQLLIITTGSDVLETSNTANHCSVFTAYLCFKLLCLLSAHSAVETDRKWLIRFRPKTKMRRK